MKLAFAAIAAVAMVATVPASAQNLLTNGSFENPANGGFAGWTLSNVGGGTAPVVIAYGNAGGYPTGAFGEAILANGVASASPDAVGRSVAYFSSDTANPDSLTQMVNLIAGQAYNVGFDYYAPQNGIDNPNDASLSLLLGNVAIPGASVIAGNPSGTPARTWFNRSSTFLATSTGPQALSFQFRGLGVTAADFAIDRVYVAAVPETATWAMMIGGFGIVGGALRRRQKVRFAAA